MSTLEQPSGPSQTAKLDADGMSRDVGFIGLLWSSETSLIGSGWLFGALSAAILAGPAVIISWIIASIMLMLLALVHAELGGLFPVSGGTSRYPHYALGSLAGATFGWMAYIQAATVAPIEVEAVIQYLATESFAKHWYITTATGSKLSGAGLVAAVVLEVIFTILNLIGVRWLARVSNTVTWWKVGVPILTIIVLLLFKFHSGNFTAGGGFFVHGDAFAAILTAIPGGGIVFSLLGFEQAVQLGGEARNPKDIPKAVIIAMSIGVVIYVLVQVAFIGAMNPATIAHYGWAGLSKDTALSASPFYTLAKVAGLAWLAYILRIDAIISPGGTGLIYLTSSSRLAFGLSKNGYIPDVFEKVNPRTKVPWVGVIVSMVIGLIFLLPFPSWGSLVSVVTSASVFMYAGAPLALGALRRSKPDLPRIYRLPAATVLSPLAFVFATEIIFFSGWGTVSTLLLTMIIGFIIIGVSIGFKLNANTPTIDWGAWVWILPYLVGTGVLSYLGVFGAANQPANTPVGIINGIGPFKSVLIGGHGDISLYWSLVIVAVFAVVIYFAAIAKRMPAPKVDQLVRDVFPPPVD
jgi:amino acid transporter